MIKNIPDEKIDLRIRRTHKLLSNSLMVLLNEKPFDDIQVSHICDKAMIHRTTFYKHFQDKYELLDFSLKQLVKEFQEKSAASTPADKPRQYYVNTFKEILEHMYRNKGMYFVGLEGLRNVVALQIFQKSIVEATQAKLKKNEENGITFSIPIPVLAEFYSAGVVSLGSWWLQNNMPISIDEMVKYGDLLINRLKK